MKKLILFLLFPLFLYGQVGFEYSPFAAADTIGSLTSQDSIECRFGNSPWQLLTQSLNDTAFVTENDKSGEVELVFDLANESYWTYTTNFQLRIVAFGTDTMTSSRMRFPTNSNGAVTLYLKPDTLGTNTFYGKSTVQGN
jgi:hypothetical protein